MSDQTSITVRSDCFEPYAVDTMTKRLPLGAVGRNRCSLSSKDLCPATCPHETPHQRYPRHHHQPQTLITIRQRLKTARSIGFFTNFHLVMFWMLLVHQFDSTESRTRERKMTRLARSIPGLPKRPSRRRDGDGIKSSSIF